MKKALSIALAGIISLSCGIVSKADGNIDVKRVSGQSRYMTSANISKEFFEKSDTAVVASGEGFVDALVGGTLTTDLDIPMFLVEKNRVYDLTLNEMKRLGVKKVYMLGGETTISIEAERNIKEQGISVERIAGRNRFETAEKIQKKREELLKKENRELKNTALVSGEKFPDALVAAPFIAESGMFMDIGTVNPSRSYSSKINMMIGGKSSIDINEEKYAAPDMVRIEGRDRFQTAVKVAESYKNVPGVKKDTVIIVNGFNYPDALAASGLVKKENAVMLLTPPNFLGLEAEKYIETNNIRKVIIVGGESSVSDSVLSQIEGRSVQRKHSVGKNKGNDTVIVSNEEKK